MAETPLSDFQEFVERSLYHSVRRECVKKGYLPDITLFTLGDNTEFTRWETELAAIKADKGFAIEVFSHSSPQEKWLKKSPRITITPNMALPGSLGGSPDRVYEGNGPVLSASGFTASILPPQTVDYYYDVIATYETAEQGRILNAIIALALPQRSYIDSVDENATIIPDNKFLVLISGSRAYGTNPQGLLELTYTYEIPDIFEIKNRVVNPLVASIQEITIITENPLNTDQIIQIIT